MENLDVILKKHPFFHGMTEEHLRFIAGCAANEVYKSGEYLFREGESANKFYFIRQGHVSLELHAPERGVLTIQTLGEGDVLGWSWLIPPYKWHFDARATTLTRVLALDGKCLRKKCEEDYQLGYELMKRIAHIMEERLHATRLQLLDMYGVHA